MGRRLDIPAVKFLAQSCKRANYFRPKPEFDLKPQTGQKNPEG